MRILRTVADVRTALAPMRARGSLGFVPTMGALHQGHVALFRTARATCQAVAASIFVNPAQFDDPADLERYPRREAQDAQLADDAGVDVLFAPAADEMYPAGFALSVGVQGPALGLEGAHRAGHFAGVATVCLKLFTIVQPTDVFLGQKDAQQVAVLRRLVRDANLDLAIRVVPTVRDRDGLALSSRNATLSSADRDRALAIPGALAAGVAAHRRGDDPAAAARAKLGDLKIDYVEVAMFDDHPTLAIAAWVGRTRLIDNVPLDQPALAGLGGTSQPDVAAATGARAHHD
jgi:pantoate--beta-alanine ligase